MIPKYFISTLFFLFYRESTSVKLFPKNFEFGAGTSAFQIEGAWNEGGKGPSSWDELVHQYPIIIADHSNADIACDSYHKYKEDVQMLKQLGVDFYRFSISWPRVLPKGTINYINNEGIEYYNNLINELLRYGIEPMVTLYHWDLPHNLEKMGGFTNEAVNNLFLDYADLMFKTYGDRVKSWTTFNEPKSFCLDYPIGIAKLDPYSGIGWIEYLCVHNIIKSHAKVYHLYNNTYKPKQGGKLSITLNLEWDEAGSSFAIDEEAAERRRLFDYGIFAHPLVFGNYPQIVIDQVGNYSKKQGLALSRLPVFTEEEKKSIKGTYDFFALNHYSTWLITNGLGFVDIKNPNYENDFNANYYKNPLWPGSSSEWLKVAPNMIRKLLNWISKTYGSPEIYITENGYSDYGELNDKKRIKYYEMYLKQILYAIHEDKINVTKFSAWSLMDNFEWINGYKAKFGFYHVDFSSPNRTRTPKASVKYYNKLIKTRCPVTKCKSK